MRSQDYEGLLSFALLESSINCKFHFYCNIECFSFLHKLHGQIYERENIRDLMWFSDLENLLSIGRIFYQLGESYLNLFLLHKVENLWSVRNLWSIFTSLSALEDFFYQILARGMGGGGAPYPQISDHQFMTFSQRCPTKCFHFALLHFLILFSNWSMVCPEKNVVLGVFTLPCCTLIIFFSSYNMIDPEKRISYIPLPTLYSQRQTRLFQLICVFHGMRTNIGWTDFRKKSCITFFFKFNYFGN